MNFKLINEITYRSPIEQILINRGIEHKDIYHFLHTTSKDEINPLMLDNIREGAQMLIKHISNNDKIFIQIDEDTDGYASSAIMINYLHCLFPYYTENYIIYNIHDSKEHGLNVEAVPEDVRMIMVIDAGSNELDKHKLFYDKGIDMLILDHHQVDEITTYACLINNQTCGYPNKALTGGGIVYKFCSYIDSLLGTDYISNYKDLVALSLISDMVNTQEFETQYLIQDGLKEINNPYMREMGSRNALHFVDNIYLMKDVAWYITPYINSITRVGEMVEKQLLFESMIDYKAFNKIPSTKRGCSGQLETVVEQAGRMSTNVKNRQNEAVDIGIAQAVPQINLDDKVIIILFSSGQVERGLNGLIANKLAAQYQRPCLVLQDCGEEYAGSGRGYEKSDLKDFRTFCLESNLCSYAQGHLGAFGLSILKENIDLFKKYCNENLKDIIDGNICYDVDYIWDAKNIPEDDVLTISNYKELWGQQVSEPYVAIKNITLNKDTIKFMGKTGKTLKISLDDDISIIKFFCTDEEKDMFSNIGNQTWFANAICYCDKNEWNGNINAQFKLEDFEIVKKWEYYF